MQQIVLKALKVEETRDGGGGAVVSQVAPDFFLFHRAAHFDPVTGLQPAERARVFAVSAYNSGTHRPACTCL